MTPGIQEPPVRNQIRTLLLAEVGVLGIIAVGGDTVGMAPSLNFYCSDENSSVENIRLLHGFH